MNRIIHIENGKLNEYSGGYSDFELQRAEHLAQQQSMYEAAAGDKPTCNPMWTASATRPPRPVRPKSRLKAMERMEKILPAHADSEFSFEFREPSLCRPRSSPWRTSAPVTATR